MTDLDPSQAARTVARALARTSLAYRRTGIVAAVAALGGCLLTFIVELSIQKGVSLALTMLCALVAYRAIRAQNRYLDPGASPVLRALAEDRGRLRGATREQHRPSFGERLEGTPAATLVRVDAVDGHDRPASLLLLIPEAEIDEVIAAFEALRLPDDHVDDDA
ncbi:MAG: hypothetical protein KC731_15085 [Myxococcales bacterium]|nr:hypothetical protein [Myxococcales bacterium]